MYNPYYPHNSINKYIIIVMLSSPLVRCLYSAVSVCLDACWLSELVLPDSAPAAHSRSTYTLHVLIS